MPRADWLSIGWQTPAGVDAACSERTGGVSRPPYESLNLGSHVGDDPVAVDTNRKIFAESLGARPVYLEQVHGTGVVELDADTQDFTRADGCFTRARGVACTVMVADCLPVLFAAEDGSVVGAAHAGWRGLAGGVLEAVVAAMGVAPSQLGAWLGPCIGPSTFEVGPEVRQAFLGGDAGCGDSFAPHGDGKFLADLPGLARRRLARLGITQVAGNDGTLAWCTYSSPSFFFSHRRDGVSGRFAAAVWRR